VIQKTKKGRLKIMRKNTRKLASNADIAEAADLDNQDSGFVSFQWDFENPVGMAHLRLAQVRISISEKKAEITTKTLELNKLMSEATMLCMQIRNYRDDSPLIHALPLRGVPREPKKTEKEKKCAAKKQSLATFDRDLFLKLVLKGDYEGAEKVRTGKK
jgi:hypothetical protein